MRITRRHNMTKEQARSWADAKRDEMLARFGDAVSDVSHRWQGDTMEFGFTAMGMIDLGGALRVTETEFALDMPFPMLAKGYEGRAKAELNRWLDENLPR